MTTRVPFRGFYFDARTIKMIQWAEKKAGFKFTIVQGSYHTGTAASAGTHDGGGAVDLSVRLYSKAKITVMVNALKDAGFAAWSRTTSQGFSSNHVHGIAIGCMDAAPLAKSQMKDFDAHRNGLKDHAIDPTYRPNPKVKFDVKTNAPVPRA